VTATAQRQAARAEVVRLQGVEYQSREWVKLQSRLAEARERCRQAEALLADAPSIETAVERLRDLREWLPQMRDIHLQRGHAFQAQQEVERVGRQRQDVVAELERQDHAVKQARSKRASLQQLIGQDEQRQRQVDQQLRELSAQVEKLKQYERHEADLTCVRGELASLPSDGTAQAREARQRVEVLTALAQVVPLLARLQSRREELRQALAAEQAAQKAEQEVLERGKACLAQVEGLKPQVQTALATLQAASGKWVEAQTVFKQARESLHDLTNLDGAKVCRHCGQPLTPGHLAEEKRRRKAAVTEAECLVKQTAAAHTESQEAEQAIHQQYDQAEKVRQDARVEFGERKEQSARTRQEVARLQTECGHGYSELPPEFRSRVSPAAVADWLATIYPTADDLARVRAEAAGLPAARQALHQAEQLQQQWSRLKAQEEGALANLERLRVELPADRQGVRQRYTELLAEDTALQGGLSARRTDLKEDDKDLERLERLRDQAKTRQVELDGELKKHEVQREHAQQMIGRVVKNLPERWRGQAEHVSTNQISEWAEELQTLQQKGTEERGVELTRARLNRAVLEQTCSELVKQQDSFDAEARQDPAILQAQLEAARERDQQCDEDLGQARQKLAELEGYCKQREEVDTQVRVTEGELEADKLLADLLGREWLQLYLVRQAERQVVEYANAVLDRLSGGQLYLKLTGEANGDGNAAKALELEAYNRVTGEKPINVAFLSGSQKFRVAVSLALGIGQYASRQHRPIESVIIDEGFGCLDSQGRQVMIQELQNLRGQMRCILLVSHQEEFADAFPDGYHFQLDGGATRIRRFQR
jgi:DNA repair exonuclease SbcCD ATPase subunit